MEYPIISWLSDISRYPIGSKMVSRFWSILGFWDLGWFWDFPGFRDIRRSWRSQRISGISGDAEWDQRVNIPHTYPQRAPPAPTGMLLRDVITWFHLLKISKETKRGLKTPILDPFGTFLVTPHQKLSGGGPEKVPLLDPFGPLWPLWRGGRLCNTFITCETHTSTISPLYAPKAYQGISRGDSTC